MQKELNNLILMSTNVHTIDIVGDVFIPTQASIYVSGDQLAIAKSFYKKILQYVTENIFVDPERCSHAGALIGTYDDRVWVFRRRNRYLNVKDELKLCHLGITTNPKCQFAFENIRYFVKECKDEELIKEEFDFCEVIVKRRKRNTLLWRHLVWLTKEFPEYEKRELEWVKKWVANNPADCSAFYYLEFLLPRNKEDLIRELQENTVALFFLPGHESTWNHRRFLLQSLKEYFIIPDNWKQLDSPKCKVVFPLYKTDFQIRNGYQVICDEFCISINLIFKRNNENKKDVSLNLQNEDIIVALSRGDDLPAEYIKQKSSAEKHYIWLRYSFIKMLKK